MKSSFSVLDPDVEVTNTHKHFTKKQNFSFGVTVADRLIYYGGTIHA